MPAWARHDVAVATMRPQSNTAAISHGGSSASATICPPSGVARYRRLDEGRGLGALAAGSFGRIYVAVDQASGDVVAVKRQSIPSDAATQELAYYKAIGQYGHPHVMALLDHFVVQSAASSQAHLYMVFDLMDTSLWSLWLNRRRVISLTLAQRFLRQLVDGVAYLHSLGLVHTDLSMANMLIGRKQGGYQPSDDVLRISDMGGAVSAFAAVLDHGEVITTAYCRAPEIFLGATSYSSAVDVWAVGVAGIALLCGELLFWRAPRFTASHVWFEAAPDAATSQGDMCWTSVLRNVVAVLGPVSRVDWCHHLPLWPQAAAILSGAARYESLGAALKDATLVRRPVDPDGPAVRLLSSWLRWRPADRLLATDSLCADLSALYSPSATPLMIAALRAASPTRLRSMVLKSWLSGLSVDAGDLNGCAELAHGQLVGPTSASHDVASQGDRATGDACSAATSQAGIVDSDDGDAATSQASLAIVRYGQGGADVASGGEPQLCECAGHCGRRECMRMRHARSSARKFKRQRHSATSCVVPALPGERFCVWCKCEFCGSGRQQCHGRGRWCSTCTKGLALTGRWYVNQHGAWSLCKNWSESLQCTARAAFLTNAIPPRDAVAWRRFLDDLDLHWSARLAATGEAADDEARRGYLMFVTIVGMLKWPSLVEKAMVTLTQLGIQPHAATAADWRNYVLEMLECANGHVPREELRSANPGRAAAWSGMICMARTLCIIKRLDATTERLEATSRRRRLTCKTARKVYRLGAMQNEYDLLPACDGERRVQEIMDTIANTTVDFRTAISHDEITADILDGWIRQIAALSLCVCGGSSEYSSGSLARQLLSVFEHRYGAAVWDKCSAGILLNALPDIGRHIPVAARSQDVGLIRKRFGMSILIISGMACIWEQVDSDCRQAVLRADCLELLRAAESCACENPQPQDWAPHVARR